MNAPRCPPGAILALNSGSSSLKFGLFSAEADLHTFMRGGVLYAGTVPHLRARDAAGKSLADRHLSTAETAAEDAGLGALMALANSVHGHAGLVGIGHRIVHGGADHVSPERITPELEAALEVLTPLDPMHMPQSLALIRAVTAACGDVPQIACFDTAFHATMPLVARQFALPRAVTELGIRRYGFHGLSCEYIVKSLGQTAPMLASGSTIIAHLGAGASLCAIKGGQSIASTMGISVLDGLMMATRCGSLDPGAIFYLSRLGHSLADIEDMLYHRSGLLGVSGISGDMRVLLASKDPHAQEAIDIYTYRIAVEIGAMVAALDGLDGIVFTAGVGAHSPAIRDGVCARLQWLGVRLDEAANRQGAPRISAANSQIDLRIVATDEETVIAGHARDNVMGL